jgi:glycosyltransferase involved in cell wall biosynthesis
MHRRLRVLISAYACEPDKGSEPEVGWQWALQMARFHDVTVLTRANNKPGIEAKLATLRGQRLVPTFVYHEESNFLQGTKQRLSSLKLYYVLWQRSAREVIAQLHARHKFDLLHHVTFAGFRYPTAIWGHGVPSVWGPIGGIESVPWNLLPWGQPASLLAEIKRNLHNLLQAGPFQVMPRRARASTVILACTPEMQAAFARHHVAAPLMPTIGLDCGAIPFGTKPDRSAGPLRLLFVGNLITLKGIDFAIHALRESDSAATLTLIGSGEFQASAQRLVRRLGLEERVKFLGQLPRAEVLRSYADFDVFIFPSLHDTGGYAVIEAMLNELPVICLDCGGPALAVQPDCGVKVSLGSRREVRQGLAAAIRRYDQDRSLLRQHGVAARRAIQANYDWDQKGEQMDAVYQRAISPSRCQAADFYTGISNATHMIHRLISFKGLAALISILLLIGVVSFVSLKHLKGIASEVVTDTLPRLALAGQANAYLADANRTITYIFSDSPTERTQIRQDILELSARTTGFLEKYGETIATDADRKLYHGLLEQRKAYLQLRTAVLDLADNGQREAAIKMYTGSLLPAHNQVKAAADQLFDADIQRGEQRSKQIMNACILTQITVALIGVAVFVLGFFFGLFR